MQLAVTPSSQQGLLPPQGLLTPTSESKAQTSLAQTGTSTSLVQESWCFCRLCWCKPLPSLRMTLPSMLLQSLRTVPPSRACALSRTPPYFKHPPRSRPCRHSQLLLCSETTPLSKHLQCLLRPPPSSLVQAFRAPLDSRPPPLSRRLPLSRRFPLSRLLPPSKPMPAFRHQCSCRATSTWPGVLS